MMSSMRRMAFFAPSSSPPWPAPRCSRRRPPSARSASPTRPAGGRPATIGYAIADWRRLRAERRLSVRRLCALPRRQSRLAGRKRDAPHRREGDAAAARSPLRVTRFFRSDEPRHGNGWARLAEAYARHRQARRSAGRGARARGSRATSANTTRACCWRASAAQFGADRLRPPDRRLAVRQARERRRSGCCRGRARPAAPPSTRAHRDASRVARRRSAITPRSAGSVTSDAGLMMDRIRYLRDGGNEQRRRASSPRGRTISPTARRSRALLRDARHPRARRGGRPPIHHRLQHRPPGRRQLRRRAPTSASRAMACATNIPR